jgi:PhnB protein
MATTYPDGRLSHGEMQAGEGVIMLATPTPDYQAPRHHREDCEPARKWSTVPYIVEGVLVYVDDVDAHFAQAKQRGASIISGVEADQYGKRYRSEDVEGHRWMFMERS